MAQSTRPVIYICGPLSRDGKWLTNIHIAGMIAGELIKSGFAPITPHLLALGQLIDPVADDHDYDTWMSVDCAIVGKCDALLRLPGESKGGDIELAYAKKHGVPVFYELDELEEHFGF